MENNAEAFYISSFNQQAAFAGIVSSGGFVRTLIKWLNDGAIKSPQEMAATVTDIIKLIHYLNQGGQSCSGKLVD